jgi:DNA-binding response OmpR family regulator
MAQQQKVLIVDDDHDTHGFIAELIDLSGYASDCVHRADEAHDLIRHAAPDFLIVDLHIERPYAGWTLLEKLHAEGLAIPFVLATSDQEFVLSHRNEARGYGGEMLQKPFDVNELITLVEARLGSVEAP